jgi:hypothetical protein
MATSVGAHRRGSSGRTVRSGMARVLAGTARDGGNFKASRGVGRWEGVRRPWEGACGARMTRRRARRWRAGGAALVRSGSNVSVCLRLIMFFSKFLN